MSNDQHLDTFTRSCRHWSEDGRAGMEAFYQLATVDYRLLAEQLHWGQLLNTVQQTFGSTIRLLDVACGSGQFPAALLKHGQLDACKDLVVDYALLDPAQFSIDTARSKLAPPFVPNAEFQCTIQEFDPPASKYAISWATHALYCVPPTEIGAGLDQMLASVDTGGLGFIAHASKQSHYVHFHDLYLQELRSKPADPYTSGENILDVLKTKVDPAKLHYWAIEYEGKIELEEQQTAERYLQRCLFDDTVTLDEMLQDQHVGKYLRGCMDTAEGIWRFPQKVWLIFFGDMASTIAGFQRH
jgi:SAM-dependent methyltransferase